MRDAARRVIVCPMERFRARNEVRETHAATMATTLADGVAGMIGVQNRATVRLAPAVTV